MADPMSSAYLGARHAQKADDQITDPEPFERKPVASFSNPAGNTQSWASTGSITNSAGMQNRKHPGSGAGLSGLSQVEGPIDVDAGQAIVDAHLAGMKKPGQADDPNPVATSMDAPDHPMLGRLRSGQPSALSNYGREFQRKVFSQSPAEQQMSAGVDSSASATKPKFRGQVDDAGDMNFSQLIPDLLPNGEA